MALSVIFTPPSMNAAQYEDVLRRLEAAGSGSPPGRLHHVCYGSGSQLRVHDIFDSHESFEAFGRVLMPILQEVSLDPGQPDITEVHNVIVGRPTAAV